jgi:magnesium transporter
LKVGYAWHEALVMIDADSDEDQMPIWHVRAWQWGCLMYFVGNGLQFFSYAFAAQTLLLAMSSVQFATHLVSAQFVEGIVVPWRCIWAAAIVLGANVILIVFSSKSSNLLDANDLIALHRYSR